MSARYALLGMLLDRGESYPYELVDRLASRLGPAWNINSGQASQIFRALERDGVVERVERPGQSRDRRQIYRLRPAGAEEYERWFSKTAVPVPRSRRPLMVKLALAGPDRLQAAHELIDAYERACAAHLNDVKLERSEVPNEAPYVRADHVLLRLSLKADIIQLEGELRWAKEAHEVIGWLLEREVMWPSARERQDAASEAARRARKRLFGRMAAKASLSTPRRLVDADGAPVERTTGARREPSDMGG
ncbi:MAG TPA: PadR family transcriptional regulator [Solirubrobacteraceae bacterium]|nr:PadR family transcriptional regulator [Solirubrobacteraceae bacterium]